MGEYADGGVRMKARVLVHTIILLLCLTQSLPGFAGDTKPSLTIMPIESGKFFKMTVEVKSGKRVRFYMERTIAGVKEKRQIKQDSDPSDGIAIIWRPRGMYGATKFYAVIEYLDGTKVETDHLSMLICRPLVPVRKKKH